jgi:hypothetical protein
MVNTQQARATYEQLEQEVLRLQGIDQRCQALETQIDQECQSHQETKHLLARAEAKEKKNREIRLNPGTSDAFKIVELTLLYEYSEEVLAGKKFRPNVERICKAAAISEKTLGTYFNAANEQGEVSYGFERGQNKESGQHFTDTEVAINFGSFGNVPLKASRTCVKIRESETKRREARRVAAEPCPHCGCTDDDLLYSSTVNVCRSCGKSSLPKDQQIVKQKNRLVAEDVVDETELQHEAPPTHNDDNHTSKTVDVPLSEECHEPPKKAPAIRFGKPAPKQCPNCKKYTLVSDVLTGRQECKNCAGVCPDCKGNNFYNTGGCIDCDPRFAKKEGTS